MNGRPAAEAQSAASPPPRSDSQPVRVYRPMVTAVVYTAYADHSNFEIATADAAKIYYAVVHASSEEPNAQMLKEMAAEAGAEGRQGTEAVFEGTASVSVTHLEEAESFVLYVLAEAPDGTLSKVYKHLFVTEAVKIVNVSYTRQPLGQMTLFVTLNALIPTPVYWLLTDEPDDDIEPLEIMYTAGGGCDAELSTYCGEEQKMAGTDTAVISLESVDAGSYYLYAIAWGRQLSPVYRLEVQAD